MELEGLFTSSKWEIIQEISRQGQSPLQLAQKLNTSIANISQQLRLLEAAGLVKKVRLPQRDRGKPRVVFSLNQDYGYLIAFSEGFAAKRLLTLDPHHKFLLSIWFIEDRTLHEEVEQFYFRTRAQMEHVRGIATDSSSLFVYVKKGKQDVISAFRKEASALRRLKLVVKTEDDVTELSEGQPLHILYDPEKILLKKVRGG